MAESIYQESMGVTGLPGVQTSTRLVGTVSGSAPTSGTFSTNDFVVDQTGGFWVCSSGGTPGNWTRVNSNAAVASVNLTAQTAAISPTTLYTTTTSGLFNISYYAKVTTPAGSSSNLGPFNVISTDPDGNAVTTVGFTSSQNSSVSGFISGNATVYVGSGTNIQYSLGYTSSGSPSMAYSLHAIVSSSVIAPSINAVNSFNGRTGAVTPGSSDYTASQVGAVSYLSTQAGKNILINGAMDFWQRGTSFSSLSTGTYVADRWNFYLSGSGALTISQSTTVVPPVAGNSMKLAVTTSATSGLYFLGQNVEANNIMATQWGTSSAQTVTMSFWVYSSLTGTFTASIRNGSANRSYLAPYTISTANTWQYVTITIPGDTNSAWIGSTSGTSAGMYIGVDCGSTTTSSSTANTWITGNYTQLTTSTNFMGSTSNVMYVSAFQLEIASTATAFSRAGGTIQGELAACQRYYQFNQNVYSLNVTSGTAYYQNNALVVQMRATPTVVFTSVNNNGFPSTPPGLSGSTSYQFGAQQTANATTNGAYNTYSYTASAEL